MIIRWGPNHKPQMMAHLTRQPISIAVEADQKGFQLYKKGIFGGKCGTKLDHGVLLIGMGTDYNISANGTDYFIIKNRCVLCQICCPSQI